MLVQAGRGDFELTAAGWRTLTIAAGGSDEEAEAAVLAYLKRQVKAGKPVEGLEE